MPNIKSHHCSVSEKKIFKEIADDAWTHARMHGWQRTNQYHKSSPWLFVPGELKRIKRDKCCFCLQKLPSYAASYLG